jgi:hypothetical protein
MAHFARIDRNNVVKSVHVVDNEHLINEQGEEEEDFGIVYLNKIHGVGFTWVQISYNSNFRKQYASIGYTYDKVNDVFISLKPFPSWILDASFDWQSPTAYPDDGKFYTWNEDTQAWNEIE